MISTRVGTQDSLREFYASVFNTMMTGLLVTAGLTYVFQAIGITAFLVSNPIMFIVVLLMPLIITLFGFRESSSSGTLAFAYYLINILFAMSMSVVVSKYTNESVFVSFLTTALAFGGLSIYAKLTKKDFTIYAGMMVFALIGLIVAMLVHIFIGGTLMGMLISIAALVIFGILTIIDVQMIKQYHAVVTNEETRKRYVYWCAFSLYLNFINMFTHILRLMGVSKD